MSQRAVPRPPKPPKPAPFTEAQIRERAYALWQADPEGSTAEHWEGAIKALRRERSLLGRVGKHWQTAFSTENRAFTLDVVKVLISGFGVLATVFAGVGLYLTYQNSQAERQLNTERLVTDRFSKAVEQLGSGDIDVRLGGIYSLERIARDSPKDHWTVMEVLTAFVRDRSPLPKGWTPDSNQELKPVTTDVQSALTVIGRRKVEQDPEGKRLDLKFTNLTGANLSDANFTGARLTGTNLKDASLWRASLWRADLSFANLNFANLNNANLSRDDLSHAILTGANLSHAILRYANLVVADLKVADLEGADLEGADLEGADLKRADFRYAILRYANLYNTDLWIANLTDTRNITSDQVKQAKNWQKAHYDPAFRQQLGLPPEKPSPSP